jgi:lipoyl(octanoyl) transferase
MARHRTGVRDIAVHGAHDGAPSPSQPRRAALQRGGRREKIAVQKRAESPGSGRRLVVARLGVVDYQEAWDLQRELAAARRGDTISDVLMLLEHPHTYTLGRRGKPENILMTRRQLARRKIALYEVDRGGDVTYHGPEQLVGYPILKLPPERLDYVRYIRDVERAMLLAVRDLGAPGELQEGFSGVWIGDEKVCAIGVKVDAFGVTTHGFALNVNTDLSYFGHIIPCGLDDKGVTSLQRVLKRRVAMRRVEDVVVRRLAEVFDLDARPRSVGERRLTAMLRRAV